MTFVGSFWLIVCLLDLDLHIFADPDQGTKQIVDPTNLDSKHCFNLS